MLQSKVKLRCFNKTIILQKSNYCKTEVIFSDIYAQTVKYVFLWLNSIFFFHEERYFTIYLLHI